MLERVRKVKIEKQKKPRKKSGLFVAIIPLLLVPAFGYFLIGSGEVRIVIGMTMHLPNMVVATCSVDLTSGFASRP